MTEEEMVLALVTAAEKGFPSDRQKQIQQISARASQAPMAYMGIFLKALEVLADKADKETTA